MQIGKAARSNGSHIKSRLKMEPHGVFKEVTKQCTNKDHYQSVSGGPAQRKGVVEGLASGLTTPRLFRKPLSD